MGSRRKNGRKLGKPRREPEQRSRFRVWVTLGERGFVASVGEGPGRRRVIAEGSAERVVLAAISEARDARALLDFSAPPDVTLALVEGLPAYMVQGLVGFRPGS